MDLCKFQVYEKVLTWTLNPRLTPAFRLNREALEQGTAIGIWLPEHAVITV